METKSILKSKIFWLQVVAVLVGGLTMVSGEQLTKLGITGVAQNWALLIIGAVTAFGTVFLRANSTTAINPIIKKK